MKKLLASAATLLILLLPEEKTSAQLPVPNHPVDTNYIDTDPSKWSIRAYSVRKENRFYLTGANFTDIVSFIPENKVALGLGFSYHSFSIDLGFPVYQKNLVEGQHTVGINFLGSLYNKQHAIDIMFQTNTGFSQQSAESDTAIGFPEIRGFQFGIDYNYLFNYRRFSFNPPFIGTQIQKKSAGSPMVGVFFSSISINSNEPLELSSPNQEHPESPTSFTTANLFSAGLSAGYAYTLVLPYKFFISASLTPGILFTIGSTKLDTIQDIGNPITLSPKIQTRNSIGYGGKVIYGFFSYGLDVNVANLRNGNKLIYTPEKIKLVIGYRIMR